MVSVSIITKNEEACLGRCLESVKWSDDIVVLDSGSTDGTAGIAAEYPNVRFLRRPFDDYSLQRNAALHDVDYANPWVFIIDADETCAPALRDEILREVSAADDETVVFHLRKKDYFRGKWMKHTTMYPVWFERLVRPREVEFRGEFSEKLFYAGRDGFLSNHLDHFPFEKGLEFWVERHNRYSTLQAAENRRRREEPLALAALLGADPLKRRVELKKIYERIPHKWLLYILYNFFVKMCFLHGRTGIEFVLLRSYYEYLVEMKTAAG